MTTDTEQWNRLNQGRPNFPFHDVPHLNTEGAHQRTVARIVLGSDLVLAANLCGDPLTGPLGHSGPRIEQTLQVWAFDGDGNELDCLAEFDAKINPLEALQLVTSIAKDFYPNHAWKTRYA